MDCSLVTNNGVCGLNYCNNHYWNGSSCVSCQTVPFAQSYAITASLNNVCFCISGYVWDGVNFACKSCTSFVTQAAACGSGQCQNFVWISGSCVDCSLIPNSVGFVMTSINNQCACAQGYFWSNNNCTSCNAASFSQCGSLTCNNYFWNGKSCSACSSVAGAVQYAYTYGNNTKCQCSPGLAWSRLTLSCYNCQSAATAANCGTDCINYYWGGTACINCQTITNTVLQTGITNGSSCFCQQNYTWNSGKCTNDGCPLGMAKNMTTKTCQCIGPN